MFLSHFTGTPLPMVLDMPSHEVREWYETAVKLHNEMNRPPDE